MSAIPYLPPVPDQGTPVEGMPPLRRAFAGTNGARLHHATGGTSHPVAGDNPRWSAERLIRLFGDQA